MNPSKPVIGLAGGIGGGKSAVAAEFEKLGCVVIDSDRLNHEVLETTDVKRILSDWWGEDVIGPDGRIRRDLIAQVIFSDPAARRRLESLVFPLIDARRTAIMQESIQDPAVKAIVLDSPLLFESGLDRQCSAIVFVEATEATRLRRLREARGWDLEELHRRERWQTPVATKRAQSDYTIHNEDPAELLRSQVSEVLERIVSKTHRNH